MTHELSLIFRTKMNGCGRHYGVLFPDGKVLDVQKTLSIVSISEFTKNGLLPITKEVTRLVSELDLKVRASVLKNFIYDLFNLNCEHVSRLLVEGKAECKQIDTVRQALIAFLKIIIIALGAAFVICLIVDCVVKISEANDQAA